MVQYIDNSSLKTPLKLQLPNHCQVRVTISPKSKKEYTENFSFKVSKQNKENSNKLISAEVVDLMNGNGFPGLDVMLVLETNNKWSIISSAVTDERGCCDVAVDTTDSNKYYSILFDMKKYSIEDPPLYKYIEVPLNLQKLPNKCKVYVTPASYDVRYEL